MGATRTRATVDIVTASAIEEHLVSCLKAAPCAVEPFPHFYASSAFPTDFYAAILDHLPKNEEFTSGGKTWFGLDLEESGFTHLSSAKAAFWRDFTSWLLGESFLRSMLTLVYPYLEDRFADRNATFVSSASLARSMAGHVLGPHTDMKHRVMTLLFYLPKEDSTPLPGTSIYKPRVKDFSCSGGPHYGFENFQKTATINFQTNTVFGFVKTARSFHGVEPWSEPQYIRDTLQYEIHDSDRAYYYGR
jgi:hypothetical protein